MGHHSTQTHVLRHRWSTQLVRDQQQHRVRRSSKLLPTAIHRPIDWQLSQCRATLHGSIVPGENTFEVDALHDFDADMSTNTICN